MHSYPLNLTFQYRLAPQLSITDSSGNLLFYVKQKVFALKEQITIFADQAQTQPLYRIQATQLVTTTPTFEFTDMRGTYLGAVKHYRLSLWTARYEILDRDMVTMTVTEANPWLKAAAAVLDEIPFVGLFNGYIFRPAYNVRRPDGSPVLRLARQPSMMDRRFVVESQGPLTDAEEHRALLALVLVVLTSRTRS